MAAMKRVRYMAHKKNYGEVGEMPGAIIIPDGAPKPHFTVTSYNADDLQVSEGKDIKVILDQFKKCQKHTHWIQVNGIGDAKLLEDIGELLKINPLVLEDIANSHQRPKFDDYDDYIFCTSRIMTMKADGDLTNTQFSAIVKKDLIISFEETTKDHFEAVKARLKAGKGPIRTAGPGYLCYALTDTILDMYFVILSQIGELLDTVEDRVYDKVNKTVMYDVQQLKRILIIIRRSSWPERDKINDMIRTDTDLINDTAKLYLRDAYDHCIQIMDMTENYKEIASNILDLYLSMVSNRMNEIMKVLTIISVIFIPLTFIAGIYGMNFARQNPVTNKVMPDNMPELYSPHGYVYALAAMGIIAVAMVIVFWKKGWFSRL